VSGGTGTLTAMLRPLVAGLLLVCFLGLTGCSDDDADPSGAPTAPGSDPTASSPSDPTTSATPPAREACDVLDAGELGQVLGTEVEATVDDTGCRFASPSAPDAPSLGLVQSGLSAVGGIDGAKAGIGAVVEGDVEDLTDVGDGAFVIVGEAMGQAVTGAGAVAVDGSLIQITVIPGPEVAEDVVRRITVEALTLIAERVRS
jgi:hypothetical protein